MKAVTNIPENIYKFSENKSLKALREYIDSTYDLHYSANRFQALGGKMFCRTWTNLRGFN